MGGVSLTFPNISARQPQRGSLSNCERAFQAEASVRSVHLNSHPCHVRAVALLCHWPDAPAAGPCPSLASVCPHPLEGAWFPELGLPILPRCLEPAWGSGTALTASACPWQTSWRDPSSSWSLQPSHCRGSQLPKVSTAKPWPIPPLLDNQENLFCYTACIKTEQTLCKRIWRES